MQGMHASRLRPQSPALSTQIGPASVAPLRAASPAGRAAARAAGPARGRRRRTPPGRTPPQAPCTQRPSGSTSPPSRSKCAGNLSTLRDRSQGLGRPQRRPSVGSDALTKQSFRTTANIEPGTTFAARLSAAAGSHEAQRSLSDGLTSWRLPGRAQWAPGRSRRRTCRAAPGRGQPKKEGGSGRGKRRA